MVSKTLKITFHNHFKPLSYSIVRFLAFAVFVAYWNTELVTIFTAFIIWSIDAFPALFLHIQFWLKNRDEEYNISNGGLIKKSKGLEWHYSNNEIDKIAIFLPPPAYRNSHFNLLLIGYYHFAVIILKSGEKLILTSLLSITLENDLSQIEGITVSRFSCGFCSLS